MNTEDLISIWQKQDKEIEKTVQVNQYLLQSVSTQKIKTSLNVFRRSNIFELIANFLFLFWMISVIERLTDSAPLLLSFGVLALLMIVSIIFNIQKLVLIKSINYHTSILNTQLKLERLKLYEIYGINALYFIIPICAVPFILVLGKGILDIDFYAFFGSTALLLYFIGSLIIGVLVVWFVKLFPNREIEDALSFIREIKQFDD